MRSNLFTGLPMKKLHTLSLILGITIGFSIAHFVSAPPRLMAQEEKKDVLSREEIDKRLDEILQSQKEIRTRLDKIKEQAQFAKSASGK